MKDGCQRSGVQGRGPSDNEIKIFKHCLTMLPSPHTFPVTLLHAAVRPLCDMNAVPLLMLTICLTKDSAQI